MDVSHVFTQHADEAASRRPPAPLTLVFALAMWAAAAGAYLVLEQVSFKHCCIVATLCFAGAALLLAGSKFFTWKKYVSVVLVAMLFGAGIASVSAAQLYAKEAEFAKLVPGTYVLTLVDDPSFGDYGDSCIAIVHLPGGRTYRVQATLPDKSDVLCWETLRATCTPRTSTSSHAFYWRKGCAGGIAVSAYEQEEQTGLFRFLVSFRQYALSCFPDVDSEASSLVRSISFGWRRELFANPLYGDVKAAGLAHLVAVSGAHLSIMSSAAAYLLRALRLGRRYLAACQLVLVAVFALFVGAPASALRACLMAWCAISSFFARRASNALGALALCIVGFVAFDASVAVSVSFCLSAGSTLFIILFAGYIGSWIAACLPRFLAPLGNGLGVSCAAFLATLPFSMALFAQVPLVSALSNILTLPLFGVLCAGGMAAALLFPVPMIGALCRKAVIDLAGAFCELVHLLASIPFGCIPAAGNLAVLLGLLGAAAIAVYRFWPRPSATAARIGVSVVLVCSLSLFGVYPILRGTEIIMVDVGQGDAIVLRSGQHAVLVDTGNKDRAVLAGLARHGITHLDMVVITHPDDDHCAALESILNVLEVDGVGVAADLLSCPCGNCSRLRAVLQDQSVVELNQGDAMQWGRFSAWVAGPARFNDQGGNDDSLVLQVTADTNRDGVADVSAVFSGDAESPIIESLYKQGRLTPAHIYKVAHHGSDDSVSQQLLAWMQPRIALISVGQQNRYGHPTEETLQTLAAGGVAIYRTDTQGDVVCSLKNSGVVVHACSVQSGYG